MISGRHRKRRPSAARRVAPGPLSMHGAADIFAPFSSLSSSVHFDVSVCVFVGALRTIMKPTKTAFVPEIDVSGK